MKKGILFDMIRENGGSFQMSVNNLITLTNNFKKKKNSICYFNTEKKFRIKKFKS